MPPPTFRCRATPLSHLYLTQHKSSFTTEFTFKLHAQYVQQLQVSVCVYVGGGGVKREGGT